MRYWTPDNREITREEALYCYPDTFKVTYFGRYELEEEKRGMMTREQFDALMNAIGLEARAQIIAREFEGQVGKQDIIIHNFDNADEAKRIARDLLVD